MTDASNSDFNWRSDASIAVCEQRSIAVYKISYGQIVVRRERSWDEEDDCFIPIAQENVLTVVRAILEAAGMEHVYLYKQGPGDLCHDIDWPEGPIQPRVAAMMALRPDIDWKAVNEDFNEIESEVREPQRLPLKERRALVEEALRRDPNRSNRAIATECGVSDKTVGAVRAEVGGEISDEGAEFRTGEEQLKLVAGE